MPWLLALLACGLDPQIDAPVTYTVVKGDTLFVIAREHGIGLAELKAANGLSSDTIEIGQVLLIPGGGSSVADTVKRASRRTSSAVSASGTDGPQRPALSMPAAKKCLGGPSLDDLGGDHAAAASEGLGEDDVRQAMNAFLPNVQPCLAGLDAAPAGALTLSITVGCDGRVAKVGIDGRDDWPDAASSCIADTLGYAPFPAHALPDGDTFVYPMRMR